MGKRVGGCAVVGVSVRVFVCVLCVLCVLRCGAKSKEMVILGLEPRTTALLALRSTD